MTPLAMKGTKLLWDSSWSGTVLEWLAGYLASVKRMAFEEDDSCSTNRVLETMTVLWTAFEDCYCWQALLCWLLWNCLHKWCHCSHWLTSLFQLQPWGETGSLTIALLGPPGHHHSVNERERGILRLHMKELQNHWLVLALLFIPYPYCNYKRIQQEKASSSWQMLWSWAWITTITQPYRDPVLLPRFQ